IEWELEGFTLDREALLAAFDPLAKKYRMRYSLHYTAERLNLAIMVSKYRHCLYDLLVRWTLGEIRAHIPLILSNHSDLKDVADHFAIPFKKIAVASENKKAAEQMQIQALREHAVDVVVLARYMQILSPEFV